MSKTIRHSAIPRNRHKNKKNRSTDKFFGYRDGYTDGMSNPKKGIDFVNYGYPSDYDFRTKAEIMQKDEANDLKDILNELIESEC